MWKNTDATYGLIAKLLHWAIAILILGLVWLGWYMVDLTYYDRWYNDSLAYHKALGIVVLGLGAAKIGWILYSRSPPYVETLKRWERIAAAATHHLFYLAMLLIPVTGYVISTSEGDGIDMFGLFTIPAVYVAGEQVRDLAIAVHYWCAYGVLALAIIHALAAVKHQLIDKDGTLRRMLW